MKTQKITDLWDTELELKGNGRHKCSSVSVKGGTPPFGPEFVELTPRDVLQFSTWFAARVAELRAHGFLEPEKGDTR